MCTTVSRGSDTHETFVPSTRGPFPTQGTAKLRTGSPAEVGDGGGAAILLAHLDVFEHAPPRPGQASHSQGLWEHNLLS